MDHDFFMTLKVLCPDEVGIAKFDGLLGRSHQILMLCGSSDPSAVGAQMGQLSEQDLP